MVRSIGGGAGFFLALSTVHGPVGEIQVSNEANPPDKDTDQNTPPATAAGEAAEGVEEQLRQRVSDLIAQGEEQNQKHEGELAELRQQAEQANQQLLETEQLLRTSGDNAAEAERLREELKKLREEASRFSREDDREIRKLKREAEEAQKEVNRLNSEVEELRNVIKEYVEPLNGGSSSKGLDQTSALRQELRVVREQADTDLNKLRKQLRDKELSGSAETAENEVLRREILEYQRLKDEQDEVLSKLQAQQRESLEEIELRNGEIDRLQRAMEIAQKEAGEDKLRRREEVQARKQFEGMLQDAQQQLEDLQNSVTQSQFAALPRKHLGESSGGSVIKGAVVGALLAFTVAEGLSILSGRGEILTGMMADHQQQPGLAEDAMSETRKGLVNESTSVSNVETSIVDDSDSRTTKTTQSQSAVSADRNNEPATGTIIQDRLRRGGHGPTMVYLRGGEFVMGHQRNQLARDEIPPHVVKVPRFVISRDEVTYDDYRKFSKATGRALPYDQGWGRGSRPVVNVSWKEAVAYTKWLSQQTGRRYRLPSEAEWEYAAAAGGNSYYWWGYQIEENHANCFDCGSKWDGISSAQTGSFDANAFGINDTAGNVMEWTLDCYHDSYEGAPGDGSPWLEEDCDQRVARGGAYNTPGDSLRTTKRFHYHPDAKLPSLGFRVVREME